jgi:hypothetical protein
LVNPIEQNGLEGFIFLLSKGDGYIVFHNDTNIQQLETENKLFSTKVNEKDETLLEFSTKTNKMENILQQEKDELLLKIQQLK